ncbi:MAG TPA: ABC transporter permease [Gaiellaceae bacterium]|nr:ABC transporter permease [Gaiellaceae bacterium]
MTLAIRHTVALTRRQLLNLWRQPWFVAITVVQPLIWLLLFGQLFKRVVELPGFHGGSYIQFLTPGVLIMSALFAGGWHGMGYIEAMDRGIMDRFLVTPAWRGALVAAGFLYGAVVIVVQSLVIVAVAFAAGASFSAGQVLAMFVLAILLGGGVAALSDALALVARQEETLIGAVQFVILPATFLSSGMMASDLLPGWIGDVARFNPVNWAVVGARVGSADWTIVGERAAWLAALLLVCAWLATRALRVYQRSV